MEVKKLANEQTEAFDVEYVSGEKWEMIRDHLTRAFPNGKFTFLDIGGGNGVFVDRILAHFPLARGTVLDHSELLLSKNKPHQRKRIVYGAVEHLPSHFSGEKFDVIFINWVLHHLITNDYKNTQINIVTALTMAREHLQPAGFLSIFENMYDGLFMDNLPSHLIYYLTSSKLLEPVVKRLGANTAGCGVCFLSKRKWEEKLALAGLNIVEYTDDVKWKVPIWQKAFLHIGPLRVGHFWCNLQA